MKITLPRTVALASCLLFSLAASADLETDLQNLTPEEAIELALQQEGATVLEVMAQAAEILQDQPEALAKVVAAAVKANPTLATQIVFTVVKAAPAQMATIVQAASAEMSDPAIQNQIVQIAKQAVQQLAVVSDNSGVEVEAEQTELDVEKGEDGKAKNDDGKSDVETVKVDDTKTEVEAEQAEAAPGQDVAPVVAAPPVITPPTPPTTPVSPS